MARLAEFDQNTEIENQNWQDDLVKGDGICWAYSVEWILAHEKSGYKTDQPAATERMELLRNLTKNVGYKFDIYSAYVKKLKQENVDRIRGNLTIVEGLGKFAGFKRVKDGLNGYSYSKDLSKVGLRKIVNHIQSVHTYKLVLVNFKGSSGHAMATYHKGGNRDLCYFFDPNRGEFELTIDKMAEYLQLYCETNDAESAMTVNIRGVFHHELMMNNDNTPSRDRSGGNDAPPQWVPMIERGRSNAFLN